MITRISVTVIMLLLALIAYLSPSGCDNCQQHLGAPFGILFAVIAAITWFKWEIIRDSFDAAKNESQLPILRLGAKVLGGFASLLRHGPRQRRPPSDRDT
jgi:Na+/proline symporter